LSIIRPYVSIFRLTINIGGRMEADILVVTSKVKKFIKEKSEMNTSAETIDVLSKAIEKLCAKGIESAKADGRKTVMARDIIIDHI
jgi:histone H3/H4